MRALKLIVSVGGSAVIWAIVMGYGFSLLPPVRMNASVTAPASTEEVGTVAPKMKMTFRDMSYGVFVGSFTLTNEQNYAVHDIGVICKVFGQSGTMIDTYAFTVYQRIQAHKTTRIERYNFGTWPQQGRSFSCDTYGVKRG